MPGIAAFAPRRRRLVALAAALAGAIVIGACGQGAQDAGTPTGTYTVQVTAARFPKSQRLTEHTHMVLTIRNAGNHPIPDLAVSVCPDTCEYSSGNAAAHRGTYAAVFGSNFDQDSLNGVPAQSEAGSHTPETNLPPWVVERNPGPCAQNTLPQEAAYSCQGGGGGGWATQNPNTWAIDQPLPPGASKTFDWSVVAITPGRYTVAWQVATDLYAKTHAVLSGGGAPAGTFQVKITSGPSQSYVNNNGQVLPGSGQGQP